MNINAVDTFGTQPRKNDRRISLLNNATVPTLTLPTPQKSLRAGRWL
jgi:hypothetical protein